MKILALLAELVRFAIYCVRHASSREVDRAADIAERFDPRVGDIGDTVASILRRIAGLLRELGR
jgi:hypothetical protein